MQTFNHRFWLRMATRKPLKRAPLRQVLANFWQVHGRTIVKRLLLIAIAVAITLTWVGLLSGVDYITRSFGS